MPCASTWRPRLLLHLFVLLSLSTLLVSAHSAAAQTTDDPAPIPLSPGFQDLVNSAPDVVGTPLDIDHPGDHPDSTIVRTTTGLMYWEPGLAPSWTDGYDRLTLDGVHQVLQWVGDALKPPAIQLFGFSIGGGSSPSSGDWIDHRIDCIEGIESHHSSAPRNQYNPVDVYGHLNGAGPHAAGWLGWTPGTAQTWGAIIGNRASEWAAARRMLTSEPESFLRTQFAGIGWGVC